MTETFVFESTLNRLDAIHFHLDRWGRCNVAMCMVAVLEREVAPAVVEDGFRRAAADIPRLRDRLRRVPGDLAAPMWAPVEEFRVGDHVVEDRLPAGADWRALTSRIDAAQSAPFAPDLPPWQVIYITGAPEGRGVVVLKVHHSLSDAAALTLMLSKVFVRDLADVDVLAVAGRPPRARAREAVAERRATVGRFLERATRGFRRRSDTEHSWACERAEAEDYLRRPSRWPVRAHEHARRSALLRVRLDDWQRAAKARHAGVNELYLAVVGASLRRYLTAMGREPESPLRVVMPVNLRAGADRQDGGNVTGAGILELSGSDGDLADLRAMAARSREAKAAAFDQHATLVDAAVDLLPGGLQRRLMFRRFSTKDALATNLVIPVECGLPGARADMVFLLAPAIGSPVSFALAGYAGWLHLAVNLDLGLIEDPARFEHELEVVLREVCGADSVSTTDGAWDVPSAATA